jgi:RNA polymerase-binding transcription factor DksA
MSTDTASKTTAKIPSKWIWHYRMLMALRTRLAGEWTEHMKESAFPLDREPMEFTETASDISEHEVLAAEVALEEGLLHEVDAALLRLREGTFGICEISGKPIPTDRLRALPWTRFTREAAEQREKASNTPQ